MNKSPSFQFYVKDWLTDLKVRTMTWAQKGMYIEVLAQMWLERCKLPKDNSILKGLLIGATDDDIEKIVLCLDVDGDNYTQKRLLQEFKKQADNREKAEEAARIRWAKYKEEQKKNKKPRVSIKEQLKTRGKAFWGTLKEFHHKNPKKYTPEMYKEFFKYWGIKENKVRPTKLVFENEKSWDLAKRLSTWYGRTEKGKNNGTPEEKPKVVKPIKMG